MNKTKLKKNAISLSKLSKSFTKEERSSINTEKRYYDITMSLRKMRESLDLTQEKLADLAKIPRTTITKVESGSRNATLQTLTAIAQAMGKDIELRLL